MLARVSLHSPDPRRTYVAQRWLRSNANSGLGALQHVRTGSVGHRLQHLPGSGCAALPRRKQDPSWSDCVQLRPHHCHQALLRVAQQEQGCQMGCHDPRGEGGLLVYYEGLR